MALSNWDTLAVDLNGKAQAGFFVSPGGVRVEIYKNYVHIHDPKAWREEGGYVKHVVMVIKYGDLHYCDVEIRVIRGPQDGVYVVCWHENYDGEQPEYTGMIGCGVSGYEVDKWVGVTPDSVEFLQKWVSNKERIQVEDVITGAIIETCYFDLPEEIARVELRQAVRYNQGDMYFAEKVGTPLDATKPGEPSDEPTMTKLLKPSQ